MKKQESVLILVSVMLLGIAPCTNALAPQSTTNPGDHVLHAAQSNGPISPGPRDAQQVAEKIAQLRKIGRKKFFEKEQPRSWEKQMRIERILEDLGSLGTVAVGGLSEIIQDTKLYNRLRERSAFKLGEIASPEAVPALMSVLSTTPKKDTLWYCAVKALGKIGESASGAISFLLHLYHQQDIPMGMETELIITLGKIGCKEKAIIDNLMELMTNSKYRKIRDLVERGEQEVAIALANSLGSEMEDPLLTMVWKELSDWKEVVSSPDSASYNRFKQREIERAMSKLLSKSTDFGDSTTIEELVSYLESPMVNRRLSAVKALGERGSAAKSIIPELIKRATDLDHPVRSAALEALSKIDPTAMNPELRKRYYVSEIQDATLPQSDRLFAIQELGRLGKSVAVEGNLISLMLAGEDPGKWKDLQLAAAQALRENYTPEERLRLLERLLAGDFSDWLGALYALHVRETPRIVIGFKTFVKQTFSDIQVLLQRGEQSLTSAI